MPSARAFVTGGSGFVGAALVHHLLDHGLEVAALSRSGRSDADLAAAGAEPIRGDVLEPAALSHAMAGCELVFHVAALVRTCRRDPSAMVRVNVEGTRNVVAAAARAGVRRLVLTSSAATIGERAGEVGNEDTPHRGWYLTAYERTKHEAEEVALELGTSLGVEVVVVNPASVQGPGRAEGSARLLLLAARRRSVPVIQTWLGLVDVEDCAAGHRLAAEQGLPGRRYLLCGASLSTPDLLAVLEEVLGRRLRSRGLPEAMTRVGGRLGDAWVALTGRGPICAELARSAAHGHRYDGSRAVRELGLAYTPLPTTLARTVAWFRDQGLLPEPR